MSLGGSDDDLGWLAGELSAIRRELLPADESRALYLALDQGGHASRAVLFDAVGREVASAHVPIATRREGERVEHDSDELVESLRLAMRDACDSPLAAGRSIEAVGLATQRSTICCWDARDAAALSPAISWQDRRAAEWLEHALGHRAEWVQEITGLPLSPHYGASKLRWCLEELPAVRRASAAGRLAMGPLASFLLHRLCRERPLCTDPANAARTLLFDPALLDWSTPLLEAFGLARSTLPRCVGTLHDYGTLELDARRDAPVRACSGDQSAAIYAFGQPSAGTAFVNVGTGAFIQRTVRDGSAPAPAGLLRSVVLAARDDARGATWVHEGTVNGAHAAIDWLRGRVGLDLARTLAALRTPLPVERVELLFVNGVGGLGSPFWLPKFPVEFTGLDGATPSPSAAGELQQTVAVVESIAFLVATNLRAMHRVAPLARVIVTGGFASCDYLCETIADVTGLPVQRPALREATARGIAWLAAGQPGDWRPVAIERTFSPRSDAPVVRRHARWQAVMSERGAVNADV